MVQINFARREVNCKIVYYGPGLSGKTTNLEKVHELAPKGSSGDLTSISTDGERTLFFDFLPFDLGEIAGMRVKLQLYTVPGQGYYDRVRRLVLQGADGVVFVADSGPDRQEDNVESLNNLEENLRGYKVELKDLPHAMQWNKRDLPGAMEVALMESTLNPYKVPAFEAVAFKGEGVLATLKAISRQVIEKLHRDFENQSAARAASVIAPAGAERPATSPLAAPVVAAEAPVRGVPSGPDAPAAPTATPEPRKTPVSPLPAAAAKEPAQPQRWQHATAIPPPPPSRPSPQPPPQPKPAAGPVWVGGEAPPASAGKGVLVVVAIVIVVVLAAAVAVIVSLR